MDLIDEPQPGGNAPEFSVSEIAGAVKRVIEGEFGRVRVRGEIGRVSRPASGHLYLDLKDDRAVLGAVIWKGTARGLAVQPEEGMEVVCTGRLTTFPGASKYQMIIEELAPAGVGALHRPDDVRLLDAQLAGHGRGAHGLLVNQKVDGGGVDLRVLRVGEVLRLELRHKAIKKRRLDEDGADDQALGVDIRWGLLLDSQAGVPFFFALAFGGWRRRCSHHLRRCTWPDLP